jgi:predicted GIY-YIG superfamily endonuclease
MIAFYAYILRCADGSLYTGMTDEIEGRLSQHHEGFYDGYTKSRRPLRLVYCEDYPTRHQAFARERQLKGWSRAKKEALIRQDWLSLMRLSESRVRLRGLLFDDWGNDLGRGRESSFESLRTIDRGLGTFESQTERE